jgi:hypothetical protein
MFVLNSFFSSSSKFCFCSLDLVRRPSYASRYRTVRERYPDETSPTRRTATIVRRVPDNAVVEGKYLRIELQ